MAPLPARSGVPTDPSTIPLRPPSRLRAVVGASASLWLLVLLALPGVFWLAGSRQPHVPGKPYTPAPAIDRSILTSGVAFDTLDQFVLDRLPLRQYALRVRADVSLGVFGSSPVPDSVAGKDGWLFLAHELQACDGTAAPIADPVDVVAVTDAALRTSGRRTTVVMTGSKLLRERAVTARMPKAWRQCQQAMEAGFAAIAKAHPDGIFLEPGLDRVQERDGHVFLRRDTHWRDDARLFYVRTLLDWVRPGLADEADVGFGEVIPRTSDLAGTMEVDRPAPDHLVIPRRTVDDPPAPGTFVLMGDSQTIFSMVTPVGTPPSMFDGPLAGQFFCDHEAFPSGSCDAALVKSKVFVWQLSARFAFEIARQCGRMINLMTPEVRGRPLEWGPSLPAGERIVAPEREDVSIPRLLRVPITGESGPVTVIAKTAQERRMPCSENPQIAPGGDLVVGLPAGVSVGDVDLIFSGPQDTTFGTPELVDLDG